MNEWSPNGFYSGSAATDHRPQTRLYRHYWEESWDQVRASGNLNAMNSYRIRDYQKPAAMGHQFVTEDVGIPPCYSSKKKKNVTSDPRFKRVINQEMRNDINTEVESEKLGSIQKSDGQLHEERILTDKVISYLKTPNEATLYSSPSFQKFGATREKGQHDLSEMVTKDVGFQPSTKFMQGCDLLRYSNEVSHFEKIKDSEKVKISSKTNLKRSASDCTLHLKNTFGDDNEDDIAHRIRPYPSTTRLSKVHNWIKVLPEKRRSVITVIGQTQTKPFSKILNEINQRRKLAKELDKHALCEAIMESSETQSDVKNLVAKVDFVLPDGKVIYSAEKVYLCKDNSKYKIDKDCGEYKPGEFFEGNDPLRKRCEMIPERDSSITQVGKRNKLKRTSRKLGMQPKEKIKIPEKIKSIYTRISFKLLWTMILIVFLATCSCACFYAIKPPNSSILFELFKPKTTTWSRLWQVGEKAENLTSTFVKIRRFYF